ncbi:MULTISPECIES: hypothetical protein [unclassified Sphingomonas]|uniref:hypothetical protein n=1 Tax=unclassified Sphingomonas TaxID=196159 RepID=UPI000BD8792D|nr:MAG: hypothetical protein B7Z43_02440 [Sphingomonas sp. 12-62-6]OYX39121.1 MAG: hypothetical protein B7Y98_06805 [Sphingomonas sp. 32-62-10]OYY63480.1 MAG: hypothetical protein B7Y49_12925 [Sphingomonas sp. 28-62-11]
MVDYKRDSGPDKPASPTTIVVERGGSGAGLFIGFAILLLVAVGAYFLMAQKTNDQLRTEAIGSAATKVGDSAEKAGAAVERAVDPDK